MGVRRLSSPPQHEGEGLSSQPPGATSDGPTCSSGSTSSQDPDPWVAPKSTFIRSKGRHHSNHTAIPENFSLIVHFPNYVFAEKQKTEHSPRPGVPRRAGETGPMPGAREGPDEGTHEHTGVRRQPRGRSQGGVCCSNPQKRYNNTLPCSPKTKTKTPYFYPPPFEKQAQ